MATFEITMADNTRALVIDAEGYAQEGPMTTFFVSDDGRGRLDSWATRMASVRSADVLMIRRVSQVDPAVAPSLELVVHDRDAG